MSAKNSGKSQGIFRWMISGNPANTCDVMLKFVMQDKVMDRTQRGKV